MFVFTRMISGMNRGGQFIPESMETREIRKKRGGNLMFKMLNPRRFYHAVGKKKFLEFLLLAVFILFFYGPLLNMLMLAFEIGRASCRERV